MTAELRDELIAAQALHEAEESWNDHAWDHLPDGMRAEFTRQARAVLRTLVSPSASSAGVRGAGRDGWVPLTFYDASDPARRIADLAEAYKQGNGRASVVGWQRLIADLNAALTARPDGETVAIPPGMVPWHGGDSAPEDWDGGPVLLRNGAMSVNAQRWTVGYPNDVCNHPCSTDIIAYTPSPTTNATDEAFADAWADFASMYLEDGNDGYREASVYRACFAAFEAARPQGHAAARAAAVAALPENKPTTSAGEEREIAIAEVRKRLAALDTSEKRDDPDWPIVVKRRHIDALLSLATKGGAE